MGDWNAKIVQIVLSEVFHDGFWVEFPFTVVLVFSCLAAELLSLARRRRRSSTRHGLSQRGTWVRIRVRRELRARSFLWAIPVMGWGLETLTTWSDVISWSGLTSPPIEYYYEIMARSILMLACVLSLLTIVGMFWWRELGTAEITRAMRVGIVACILSVVMQFAFWHTLGLVASHVR